MDKYVEIGGTINGYFTRNYIVKKEDKLKEIKKHNFKDIYSTIYEYDSKDIERANILAPIYIDIDAPNLKDDFDLIKKDTLFVITRLKNLFGLNDNNFEIYFSGSKGFHIVIPYTILGFEFCKDLNKDLKKLALELQNFTISKSIDTRIYDNKRLFREPNTVNSKTGLYKVSLSLDDLRSFIYEDILLHASSPKSLQYIDCSFNVNAKKSFDAYIESIKEKQKKAIDTRRANEMMKSKIILPCIAYILQNGAVKGYRNNTAMALASGLFQRDISAYDEICDVMNEWNNGLEESLSENELSTTIKSAYSNVKNNKRYGCSAFIDLEVCIKDCPIKK